MTYIAVSANQRTQNQVLSVKTELMKMYWRACHKDFILNIFYYPFYIDRILQTIWAEHSTGNVVWPQVLNNSVTAIH